MARFAVIDNAGKVSNVIEYDGVSPYEPGEGLQLVPHAEIPAEVWIGAEKRVAGDWKLADGRTVAAARAEPEIVLGTVEDVETRKAEVAEAKLEAAVALEVSLEAVVAEEVKK